MLWCAQGNDRIRESGRSEPGAFAEPETIEKFRAWIGLRRRAAAKAACSKPGGGERE